MCTGTTLREISPSSPPHTAPFSEFRSFKHTPNFGSTWRERSRRTQVQQLRALIERGVHCVFATMIAIDSISREEASRNYEFFAEGCCLAKRHSIEHLSFS